MTLVNPYLKKKKPTVDSDGRVPFTSSSGNGGSGLSNAKHVTPRKISTASLRPAWNAATTSLKPASTKPPNPKGPPMVTPGKKVASNAGVAPTTVAKPQPVERKLPTTAPPAQTRPVAATVSQGIAVHRKGLTAGLPSFRGSSIKGATSVKQQLKQEIAMLKKQKQLKKLQQEAEERRRKALAEKQEKDREMQAILAAREEERKQKQQERERLALLRVQEQQKKQRERLAEQERKREEQRIMKEMREQKEEELYKLQKQRAEEKYQRELLVWKHQHQQWLQQHQQLQQAMLYHPTAMATFARPSSMVPQSHEAIVPIPYGGMTHQMGVPPNHTQSFHHSALNNPMPYGPILNNYFMPNWMLPGPPPPPPRPPVLLRRPVRKQSKEPKCPTAVGQQRSRLCDPLECPSPFAKQGRTIVSVMLVRETDSSFGVNLILHKVSALVDPEWLDAQEENERKVTTSKNGAGNNLQMDQEPPNTDPKIVATKVNEEIMESAKAVEDKFSQAMTEGCIHSPNEEKNTESPMLEISSEPNQSSQYGSESVVNVSSMKSSEEGFKGKNVDHIINESSLTNASPEKSDSNSEKGIPADAGKQNLFEHGENTLRVAQKKRRRRRVNFAVMMVSDAEKQNARRPEVKSEDKLQPGDIVISIGDKKLFGMFFTDACSLFGSESVKTNENMFQTQVLVARKKAAVPRLATTVFPTAKQPLLPPSTPSLSGNNSVENKSLEFSQTEVAVLANVVASTLHHPDRTLGKDAKDSMWQDAATIFRLAAFQTESAIPLRNIDNLKEKWQLLIRGLDYSVAEKARQSWVSKCKEDYGEIDPPYSSEVERSALRQAARGGPRPAKGCRCGRQNHEYLFESECFLFKDIRNRLSTAELEELLPGSTKKRSKQDPNKKALNVVSSANMNRKLKLKEANEKELAEERFVTKMEEVQVKELKQAIFAPNLTTMVLSAVCELQREFPLSRKRESVHDEQEKSRKLQKVAKINDPKIKAEYLIRVLEHVSKTWGHCYRESSKEEYAWRWEVFHGSYSTDQQWEANSPHPRVPESLPFERTHFGLSLSKTVRRDISSLPARIKEFEDLVLMNSPSSHPLEQKIAASSSVEPERPCSSAAEVDVESASTKAKIPGNKLDVSSECLDQFCFLMHSLSPTTSGLYDEVLALLKMNVLRVRSGILVLADDWYENVDVFVLDDMSEYWSIDVDPDGKYCVHEEIRDTLKKNGSIQLWMGTC
ncbi:hypothetical protein IV203_030460 [Nitzschia inconspicua]|uniref:Uncharacterized protein n=1 Tax=Nitzschia inconspicua TaxID=303405 RepID=A0A9K3P9E3_9STRA|nr:hypothetical protein IV203_030460 [Nitzschia inconspicua]